MDLSLVWSGIFEQETTRVYLYSYSWNLYQRPRFFPPLGGSVPKGKKHQLENMSLNGRIYLSKAFGVRSIHLLIYLSLIQQMCIENAVSFLPNAVKQLYWYTIHYNSYTRRLHIKSYNLLVSVVTDVCNHIWP